MNLLLFSFRVPFFFWQRRWSKSLKCLAYYFHSFQQTLWNKIIYLKSGPWNDECEIRWHFWNQIFLLREAYITERIDNVPKSNDWDNENISIENLNQRALYSYQMISIIWSFSLWNLQRLKWKVSSNSYRVSIILLLSLVTYSVNNWFTSSRLIAEKVSIVTRIPYHLPSLIISYLSLGNGKNDRTHSTVVKFTFTLPNFVTPTNF